MGLILLNKKPGITSFDALHEIKRALGTGKVGHTGTLDKFAQGLLLVLTGRALKLTRWFTNCDKQYLGKIRFGQETDTLDPEGEIIAEAPLPSREQVESVLKKFSGNIKQEPPVYSAIHINGKRASQLAREGKIPEMKKRPVTIYKLELLNWEPPFAEIFVHCSSGTYIRSLTRDIALAAGSRAHLVSLTRTQVAGFKLESREQRAESSEPISSLLPAHCSLPIDKSVISTLGLPWFEIAPCDVQKIIHGKPLTPILDGLTLFEPAVTCARTEGSMLPVTCSAAVFAGEILVAVVEKKGDVWKYGAVLQQ